MSFQRSRNPFQRKTYGRIFVRCKEAVPKVHQLIRELDEFEADYCPDELVSVFNSEPKLVYLHKFEICKDLLTRKAIERGIWIWCVDGYGEFEYLP